VLSFLYWLLRRLLELFALRMRSHAGLRLRTSGLTGNVCRVR